jgi:OTU domain-containing protein 6
MAASIDDDGLLPNERQLVAEQAKELANLNEQLAKDVERFEKRKTTPKQRKNKQTLHRKRAEKLAAKHRNELNALRKRLRGGSTGGGFSVLVDNETLDAVSMDSSAAAEQQRILASMIDENENENENESESDVRGPSKAAKRRARKAAAKRQREQEIAELNEALVDPKQVELEQINGRLHAAGLRIHTVKADGHCLYGAIAHQLDDGRGVVAVRALCADYMRSHAADFEAFVDLDAAADGRGGCVGFDGYCERVRSSNDWGGQLELQALAHALDTSIRVHSATGAPLDIVPSTGDSTRALELAYHRHYCALGEHYNSVVPL